MQQNPQANSMSPDEVLLARSFPEIAEFGRRRDAPMFTTSVATAISSVCRIAYSIADVQDSCSSCHFREICEREKVVRVLL